MFDAPAPTNQPTPRIVGLDLSLTATGICDAAGARVVKASERGMYRLWQIRSEIEELLDDPPPLVIIEGYSMGGQRGSAGVGQMLGELGGVVRLMLWEYPAPYVDVPPSTLKKFATGKGNAGKPDMLAAAIRAGYEGPNDDNCVDAWWLYQLGSYANTDETDRAFDRAYRDDAIANIEWPTT